MKRSLKPISQRFWNKVHIVGPDECWLWIGGVSSSGYGQISPSAPTNTKYRQPILAHRLSYELANGAIPTGLFICHTCDVKKCVNPNHLFVGTNTDNMRDAKAKGRLHNSNKTHCAHGHEFTTENTRWVLKRECRQCDQARLVRKRKRKGKTSCH